MSDMAFPTYSSPNPTNSQGYQVDSFSAQYSDNIVKLCGYWNYQITPFCLKDKSEKNLSKVYVIFQGRLFFFLSSIIIF